MSIPGDVEMYESPGFLGHAAVFGFPLSLGSPPWGAHGGPSLLGLVSVFSVPLLEGGTGVAAPSTARLQPGALGRRCDDVMWPPASCLAAGGRICLFWHRGLFHWRARNRPSQSPGHSLPWRLPFPVGIRGYPGAQGEWAGVDLSGTPPLSGRPDPSASAEAGPLP